MQSNRIIGVIAPKGSGKTYVVSQAMSNMERVAVFDMLHEPAYLTAEPIVGKPREFQQAILQPQFSIAYRPLIFQMREGEEYCPAFEPFVRMCYQRGDMWMVIDEAHQLCTARSCPDSLLSAVRLGRHRRLSIIFITQSWSAVSRPLTANADEFIFFRVIEPADLEGIRIRCGENVREQVRSLRRLDIQDGIIRPGQMLRWNAWQGVVEVTE